MPYHGFQPVFLIVLSSRKNYLQDNGWHCGRSAISANKYSSLDVVCYFPLNVLIKNPELLNEQECQYVMNPATHLDFLIYNRIIFCRFFQNQFLVFCVKYNHRKRENY